MEMSKSFEREVLNFYLHYPMGVKSKNGPLFQNFFLSLLNGHKIAVSEKTNNYYKYFHHLLTKGNEKR